MMVPVLFTIHVSVIIFHIHERKCSISVQSILMNDGGFNIASISNKFFSEKQAIKSHPRCPSWCFSPRWELSQANVKLFESHFHFKHLFMVNPTPQKNSKFKTLKWLGDGDPHTSFLLHKFKRQTNFSGDDRFLFALELIYAS